MEQPAQSTQPEMGLTSTAQTPYTALTNLLAEPVTGAPANGTIPPTSPGHHLHPFATSQVQEFHQPGQQQLLKEFWCNQMQEIEQTTDYRNHSFPLTRIKNIMKADQDVRMISSDAPVVLAKACKIFIQELTQRSWIHTEEHRRRILQKKDIARAVLRNQIFDFLDDIVPIDEVIEEFTGIRTDVEMPGEQMPYCYVPAHSDRAAAAVPHEVQDQNLMDYIWHQVEATQEVATAAVSSSDA